VQKEASVTLAKMRFAAAVVALCVTAMWYGAAAQDMLQYLDLNSPDMTRAETTRSDVEAMIKGSQGKALDLSGKRLSGLDLSGLDLTGANLSSTRLNNTNFAKARLDGAHLDLSWALKADFSGASLKGASLFSAQMQGSKFDRADLSGARIAANLTGASLRDATIAGANCSPDMKNQSMGLMRTVLKSANLESADLSGSNLTRVDLAFANMRGAKLSGANLHDAEAGGADFRGAKLDGSNLIGVDVASARIDTAAAETAFAQAANLNRAFKE
jgi:uncharacterized protein YjbI with pentapeptide repeats